MLIFTLIIALILALIAMIFAIQNPQPVEVAFLGWNPLIEGSLALVLLVFYGAGILTGVLLLLPDNIRRRAQLASQRRKIGDLARTVGPDDKPLP